MAITRQQPIRLTGGQKRGVGTQFGALCYRVHDGKVQVLLITGRSSRRWLIPKGWPMDKTTPSDAAAREAYEEAGARGRTTPTCLGIYSYLKGDGGETPQPCIVAVFPLKVEKLFDSYPEVASRKRKWHSRKKAAARVSDPELAQIIRAFDPSRLPLPR